MPKYSNFKMEQMLTALKPILQYRGKTGYAAARNTRILRNTLTDFFQFRDGLIRNYGEPEFVDGKKTNRISLTPGSANFETFEKEFERIGTIEHEVELMPLKYDEVIEVLTGEEMLNIEWMLED